MEVMVSSEASIFLVHFVNMASSRVPIYFLYTFLFWGFLSFDPIGLPHVRHASDSFTALLASYSLGTSILVGALTIEIWDFITLLRLVWFAVKEVA